MSLIDIKFLAQTLVLANRGKGWANPNPMVGALLVKGGQIIGRGYHHQAGSPHAEIEALRRAGSRARGATLYVNLEPCNHFGRTPPCTEAIIAAGIKRVIFSTLDPNPKVHGQGARRLRANGIPVTVGLLAKKARQLNTAFFTFHQKHRPYVAVKWGMSLDGKIATRGGDSKWITSVAARRRGRDLRGKYQAILVGINTVLRDNPQLGARSKRWRDPIRIILDSALRIPLNSKALRDDRVIIAATRQAAPAKIKMLERRGIAVLIFPGRRVPLGSLLRELWRRQILSLLVEGGGEALGNFVDEKLVDELNVFIGPVVIGGAETKPAVAGLGAAMIEKALRFKTAAIESLGDSWYISGTLSN